MTDAESARTTGPATDQTAGADDDAFTAATTRRDEFPPAADDSFTSDAGLATGSAIHSEATAGNDPGAGPDAGRAPGSGAGWAPGSGAGWAPGSGAGRAPGTQLLGVEEQQAIVSRWREIQAEFVDEPREAIQEADALVTGLMERLSRAFASELDQLEARWATGAEVSTEDLRQDLQLYRSFFERLLAA